MNSVFSVARFLPLILLRSLDKNAIKTIWSYCSDKIAAEVFRKTLSQCDWKFTFFTTLCRRKFLILNRLDIKSLISEDGVRCLIFGGNFFLLIDSCDIL